jgi:hypothetical protein
VKVIVRGRCWFEQLAAGGAASFKAIADRAGVSPRYVSRLLPLAFLAPDIIETILQGRQPADLSATGSPSIGLRSARQLGLTGHSKPARRDWTVIRPSSSRHASSDNRGQRP